MDEPKRSARHDLGAGILDQLRQLRFPRAFRIEPPSESVQTENVSVSKPPERVPDALTPAPQSELADALVAEVATCLWYLKSKFFRQPWEEVNVTGDDPRHRRAVGRLNKCIALLKDGGIEVHDPTNERYPEGGEGTMRPIQFAPTDGLQFPQVSETMSPVVYRNQHLLQRGEVYVAVPRAVDAALPLAGEKGTADSNAAATDTPPQPKPRD